jgi:hypothetical protein
MQVFHLGHRGISFARFRASSSQNAPIILGGVDNTLNQYSVFQRAIGDEVSLKTGDPP